MRMTAVAGMSAVMTSVLMSMPRRVSAALRLVLLLRFGGLVLTMIVLHISETESNQISYTGPTVMQRAHECSNNS